jgi:hypothetical protein
MRGVTTVAGESTVAVDPETVSTCRTELVLTVGTTTKLDAHDATGSAEGTIMDPGRSPTT